MAVARHNEKVQIYGQFSGRQSEIILTVVDFIKPGDMERRFLTNISILKGTNVPCFKWGGTAWMVIRSMLHLWDLSDGAS